jgi:PAS domain S-box-containing protein
VGMLSTLIDITDLCRAMEWHQTILHTIKDGYILVGGQGHILDVNEAYCAMVGYSHAELYRMSIADLDAQQSLLDIEDNLRLIPLKGSAFFETKHRSKSGRLVDIEASITFLPWDGGRFVSIMRDITARQVAQARLTADYLAICQLHEVSTQLIQQDDLPSLLEKFLAAAIGIMGADSGNIQLVDPTSQELRIAAHVGLEAPFLNFFNSVHQGLAACGTSLHLGESVIVPDVTQSPIFADQTILEVLLAAGVRAVQSTPIISSTGKIVGMISTHWEEPHQPQENALRLLDILARQTAELIERQHAEATRQQLESQLFQAQKMEALGTLAGGIAHEFNNILWAIMGFSELTLSFLPEGSKGRWNIQQVLQASGRARDLVNQILAFSRKADQEKKPIQIALIVKEALKLMRATIPTTIEIKQTISAPETLVLADATQIHQIIMNLCANAAQAMREKGDSLEIRLEEKFLDDIDLLEQPDLTPGTYVILTVSDNGPGIAPDIIDKIFEPFFTTKEVGAGTGMGLAVVYGIVKSHGGAITVSSQPSEGAAFTVLLPKIISRENEDQEAQASIPKGHGHILVLDDEEMLVALSKRMLESLGYEVTTAKSSLEALEIFQAQSDEFDLVITDQTMPHMAGLQLSREFRHIRPDIPIILCTGFSEKVSQETVDAAGINGLLMKPVNLRDLGKTVREVLDKEVQ